MRGKIRSPACLVSLIIFVAILFVVAVQVYVRYRIASQISKTLPLIGNLPANGEAAKAFSPSKAFQLAVARAQSNDEVVKALGAPITADAAATKGRLSEFGISGNADLIIPLSGANKKGTLYATGRKEDGEWKFYTLAVKVDDRIIRLPR